MLVSTYFWHHGLYSKVASLDQKSSVGLIHPLQDHPLFPFSPTSTLFSLCLSPLSPFLLNFSLPLPVTPLPLLSLPHLWEAAVVRMSQMSQFVEAVCTRTHTHIYILSPTKASVSVCLSVRCSTNRRERGRQIESERQKRGGRDKKRGKKDKAENREVKREKERQVQSRENLKRRGCCC